MTTYARLKTDLTFDTLVQLDAAQYAALQANGKAQFLRLYSVDAQPTPSGTQYVAAGPYVTDATTTRKTWALVDKTQAQIDAETLAALQATELTALKAAVSGLTTDIAAGITTAPTTAAQAFIDIQELKRQMLRLNRVARWLLRQQA